MIEACENPFVVISGNIGVGKSSLANIISGETVWHVFQENVQDYIYVQDFYENMSKWSFHNQLQFILYKFKQQEKVRELTRPVCQDRSAYECYEVFTRKLLDDGFMNPRDFRCLTEFYTFIERYLPPPRLIVHLKAPQEVLVTRCTQRARPFELRTVTKSYLIDLEERYNNWLKSVTFCPVLVLDVGSVNYLTNLEDRKRIIGRILSAL